MKIIFNGRIYNLVVDKDKSIFTTIGTWFLRHISWNFNSSLVINSKQKYGAFYMDN